ncbi:MAG TPA: hypothetical protein DER09_03055 [Prolixibacteraceae bacterium]|nr:hypothetical protein [Prolixibacteraceae bacterium]
MKEITISGILILLTIYISFGQSDTTRRDPYLWPFSQQSIWNMPVGSAAEYVPAKIQKATAWGMTKDEDIIVLSNASAMTDIYINNAEWDRDKDRCTKDGGLLFRAPIPDNFVVNKNTWDGQTPNSGLAVLMPDGVTIKQTQPFSRCEAGQFGTSKYVFGDVNIFGDGYYGAHGGSGLSAIGGTLRLGELSRNSGAIRHALKINVYGARNLYYDNTTKGYRWPALRADGYASSSYGKLRDKDIVKECRMGALLALPSWMKIDSMGFETAPAKILAQAFQDYGAYVVDDTGWDVYAIVTQWSPEGRFTTEFEKEWGFSFTPQSKNTPWARDMDRIFLNLHVVDNNSKNSIGGGGVPRMPLAPEFKSTNTITGSKEPDIKIYPNPTADLLNIELGNEALPNASIKLINTLGACIFQNAIDNRKLTLNMTGYNAGIYYLQIEMNNNKIINRKIIKSNPNLGS